MWQYAKLTIIFIDKNTFDYIKNAKYKIKFKKQNKFLKLLLSPNLEFYNFKSLSRSLFKSLFEPLSRSEVFGIILGNAETLKKIKSFFAVKQDNWHLQR